MVGILTAFLALGALALGRSQGYIRAGATDEPFRIARCVAVRVVIGVPAEAFVKRRSVGL
ncbi:hypothetical protein A8H39_10830 [Paraburkholderia fungorum]|nr:hypothetical protein A8H39_10830 [Paraburkholderia fungorum]